MELSQWVCVCSQTLAEEVRHGIWTRDIALALGRAAANHSFAGNLLAPLKPGHQITLLFLAVVSALFAGPVGN
jgi:hypothetical protein